MGGEGGRFGRWSLVVSFRGLVGLEVMWAERCVRAFEIAGEIHEHEGYSNAGCGRLVDLLVVARGRASLQACSCSSQMLCSVSGSITRTCLIGFDHAQVFELCIQTTQMRRTGEETSRQRRGNVEESSRK